MKLEGNPDHPVNRGALCGRGQAALQGLYNPDRFAGPLRREGDALRPLSWDDALKLFTEKVTAARGANKARAIAIVTQLENGSAGVLADRVVTALGARPRVTLEPFGFEAIRAANRQTFGRDAIPYYSLADAEVVISFGADFVETWLSNVDHARGFAKMHSFRDGRAGTVVPHRAPAVLDGLQRRRVAPQRARHRRRYRAGHPEADARWRPGRRQEVRRCGGGDRAQEGRRGERPSAGRAGARWPRPSPRPSRGWRSAAGSPSPAVNATADAGGDQPAERRRRERRQDRPVRPRLRLRQGHALRGSRQARAGDGGRRDRGARARHRGEPGVHAARRTQGRGGHSQGAVRGELRPTCRTRRPRWRTWCCPIRTGWSRGATTRRARASPGSCSRRCSPSATRAPFGDVLLAVGRTVLGDRGGQGPAAVGELRAVRQGGVGADREGPAGRRRCQQGGVWQDVGAGGGHARRSSGSTWARRSSRARATGLALLAYPSFRFYDGRSASRSWLQETPDTMTQAVWDAVGGDQHRDRDASSGSARATSSR